MRVASIYLSYTQQESKWEYFPNFYHSDWFTKPVYSFSCSWEMQNVHSALTAVAIKAKLTLELANAFNRRVDSDRGTAIGPCECSLIRALAHAVLLPVLSAVLGEACPLYVHSVSNPHPVLSHRHNCIPSRQRGKRSQRSKFSPFIHGYQRGFWHVFE